MYVKRCLFYIVSMFGAGGDGYIVCHYEITFGISRKLTMRLYAHRISNMENEKETGSAMKSLSEAKTMFAIDVYAGDYVRVKDILVCMELFILEYGNAAGQMDTIRAAFANTEEFVKVVSRKLDTPESRIGLTFEGIEDVHWFDFASVLDVKQGVADMIELVNLMEEELKYHKHIMTNFTLYEMLHLFK